MGKERKTKTSPSHVAMPGDNIFDDRKYAEEQYHKNYEFKKKKPVRYPGSDWEYEYLHSDQAHWDHSLTGSERAMALSLGTPHSFGHGKSQKVGHLRMSGHRKAHQIGKR